MVQASQLSHKLLLNTALPYKTFTAPIDQDPQYVAGRNIMINAKSFCTMRPGFADYLELVPTTFNHVIRLFSWSRWDGTYFVMAVDHLATGQMAVYKLAVATDLSFVVIHVEPKSSGVPYSFTTANNYLFFSNSTDCWKWSPDHGIQNWGIVAPTTAPGTGLGAGSLSATSGGYCYVVTYVNSASGGESSPSPISIRTGNFASNDVAVNWPPSSDLQVDMVNIYRTTDGGAADPQKMAFVAQVPVHTTFYTDSTPDALLSAVQFAPAFHQNDPPLPMTSIIVYAGRIWGIVGSRVWYSGQEEISNGIPQECFPGASISALDGNFYAYETALTALAALTDGVAVFVPGRIQKIEGDSLDTFRRYTLLAKRGTVTDFTVKVVGNSVLWFDRSRQLWLSDEGEIGRDIRPDLSQISLLTVHAAIHIAGEQHWVCLLDPDHGVLYVYDLDVNLWNVPWDVAATTIESIDIAPGMTRLAAAINGTQIYMENPGLYLDGGKQYDAWAVTSPLSLAPDSNPDFLAVLHHVAIESNQYQPVNVAVKVDEDPGALAAANIVLGGIGSTAPVITYTPVINIQSIAYIQAPPRAHWGDRVIIWPGPNMGISPGDLVVLQGLTTHPELNGIEVQVIACLVGPGGSLGIQPAPVLGKNYFNTVAETGQVTQKTIIPGTTLGTPSTVLGSYGGFNILNTITDPPLRTNGMYLIQKNYMGNPDSATPACRRLAVRLDWRQPEPALWALYSIDLAMTPVGR